ncbi:Mariner Mos1 transposase [Caligus rogercresseyi]|uniref:Mariner Mos1 transposase n=1 Tax=Caligus rogercresseyi TaxID=217165 RepID=A0A7T8JXX5_CALRO|nr:Mariner Mos1 transposase [Caligus rogercresseyi]
MSYIHKFVEDLAKARKTPKEIKTMVDTAFEVNSISQSQIYRISALVKAGKDSSDKRSTNGRRKVRTDDFIEAVRVYVEADRRVTMEELAIKFETSISTIFHVLLDDLGLSIKSARWIPKMLTEDHKMKRVRCAKAFLKLNFELGLGFPDKIVTMEETSVSFFTPESKRGSSVNNQGRNRWFSASSTTAATSVTTAVFKDVMNMFLKKFKEKRPELAKRDWYFHFDNAPCHKANSTKEFLAKKGIKVIDHPPYSPDLAPADFFYFPVMKKMLEGVEIVDKSVQKEWTRVGRAIPEDRFREAFRKWVERWEKCIRIGGNNVEKIY